MAAQLKLLYSFEISVVSIGSSDWMIYIHVKRCRAIFVQLWLSNSFDWELERCSCCSGRSFDGEDAVLRKTTESIDGTGGQGRERKERRGGESC